jgi:hypothetical protein
MAIQAHTFALVRRQATALVLIISSTSARGSPPVFDIGTPAHRHIDPRLRGRAALADDVWRPARPATTNALAGAP